MSDGFGVSHQKMQDYLSAIGYDMETLMNMTDEELENAYIEESGE
jgi:hypothetical protein